MIKKTFRFLVQVFNILNSGKWSLYFKIVFGLLVLFLFYNSIDFEKFKTISTRIDYIDLILIGLFVIIRNIVSTLRLKVLMYKQDTLKFKTIISHYFIGSFYNNFLPTSLGGDAVRILLMTKEKLTKTYTILLVTTERTIGFYALLIIAFISLFFWETPEGWFEVISLSLLGFTTVIGILYFIKLKSKNKILSQIYEFIRLIKAYPGIIILSLLLSILFQLISIFISFYIAKVIGAPGNLWHYMTIVPMVWVFTMLPISFGGVGLREISFAYLLSFIAVTAEEAAMISIGTYFTMIFSGLIGLLIMVKNFDYFKIIKRNKTI